jgi:putative FmdB family regulatory protein
MPIYEYRCASCGHELEALQKLSDAPLTVCPACHRAELKKLVSAAGFQLKGSGWYVTDFRNSGAKPAAKDKPAASANGNGAATSTDAPSESTKSEGTAPEKGAAKPAAASPAPAATATSTKSDG